MLNFSACDEDVKRVIRLVSLTDLTGIKHVRLLVDAEMPQL